MVGRFWVVAACCCLLGCGKTSSNDPALSDAAEAATATGAGGATTTAMPTAAAGGGQATSAALNTSATSLTTTGTTLMCSSPEDRECNGECVDPRTSLDNCGYCHVACSEAEECIHARCVPHVTCEPVDTSYEPSDMQASGGTQYNDGWALATGEMLIVEHDFPPGPALLLVTARRLGDELGPALTVTVGDEPSRSLLLASTEHATYAVEYESRGRPEVVSISVAASGKPGVVGVFRNLEVHDCAGLYGQCQGGGYYLPEVRACAPPVCSEPRDCIRDFVGPAFQGECIDGACQYPSCTEIGASGLPLHEEFDSIDTHITCLSYSDLTFPLNNPRTASLAGDADDFTCPTIETLTWEVERFAGEGTCTEVPVCGPNPPEELGFESSAGECCYLVSRRCGV